MQLDFHYYATYCAAFIAGYSHEDSLRIGYSSQFTDCCCESFLSKVGGPRSAATTQLQMELMDTKIDLYGLQDITRIWASFHFLPGDLYAVRKKCSKRYLHKYRLICNTNGALLKDTVELARGKGAEAVGLAMHVLADTWAHRYFAGTPSLVINNTDYHFFEILPEGDGFTEREIRFNHNPASVDDPVKGFYTGTIYQGNEYSIMNLGHGRAGHLPDYSYARYRYMPAWAEYREVLKDNPSDYKHAFWQMVYSMKCLRTEGSQFEVDCYAEDEVRPWIDTIEQILIKRQTDASEDWKSFAQSLSGREIPAFSTDVFEKEYMDAAVEDRDQTGLGRFMIAALAQKSMVTNRIFISGNLLAGYSVDYHKKGFQGIRDYHKLVKEQNRSRSHD